MSSDTEFSQPQPITASLSLDNRALSALLCSHTTLLHYNQPYTSTRRPRNPVHYPNFLVHFPRLILLAPGAVTRRVRQWKTCGRARA